MWIKASEAIAGAATVILIEQLARDLSAHEVFANEVRIQSVDSFSIEPAEDPEVGNHNYLALSGHYGHGNSRIARSIGRSKRGSKKSRVSR